MRRRGRIPIVPAADGAGRALVALVGVLALLAGLGAGAAAIVVSSAIEWKSAIAREATVQVRPVSGRDVEADVREAVALAQGTPGVRAARALGRAESDRLLEPWLGQGLDLSDLPVPRVVALSLDLTRGPDLPGLAARLSAAVPNASLDDHGAMLARLTSVANAMAGGALAVVVLVLAASGGAIGFATRGAIAGHRDLVDVLHYVGATDRFIARAFARRFARAGLQGGLLGAMAAAALIGVGLSFLPHGPDADEAQALFGSFSMGWTGYASVLSVGVLDGVIAGLVSAATVKHFLKRRQ